MKKISFMAFLLLLLAAVSVSCSNRSVDDYVSEFKGHMPEELGNGLTMSDIGVVDNFVQIDCTNDESALEFDNPLLQSFLPAIAEPIKASFMEDSGMKGMLQACSDEGKGFRLVAEGTKSGQTVTLFEITPEELNEKFPPAPKE